MSEISCWMKVKSKQGKARHGRGKGRGRRGGNNSLAEVENSCGVSVREDIYTHDHAAPDQPLLLEINPCPSESTTAADLPERPALICRSNTRASLLVNSALIGSPSNTASHPHTNIGRCQCDPPTHQLPDTDQTLAHFHPLKVHHWRIACAAQLQRNNPEDRIPGGEVLSGTAKTSPLWRIVAYPTTQLLPTLRT